MRNSPTSPTSPSSPKRCHSFATTIGVGALCFAVMAGCIADPELDTEAGSNETEVAYLSGTTPLLVILLAGDQDYRDLTWPGGNALRTLPPFSGSTSFWGARMFGNFPSVAGYFRDVSNGTLRLSNALTNASVMRVTDDYDHPDFDIGGPAGITAANQLTNNGVRLRARWLATRAGFRYENFDRDDDGKVTSDELLVLVIDNYSQAGGQAGDNLPCVPSRTGDVDVCVHVANAGHRSDLGLQIHEVSHILTPGAIDLYGSNDLSHSSRMSIMAASGGADSVVLHHFDPWHKRAYGWMNSYVINSSNRSVRGRTIYPTTERDAEFIMIKPSGSAREAILIENRKRDGRYDRDVGAEGAIAWYVRWSGNGMRPNQVRRIRSLVPGHGRVSALFTLAPDRCTLDPNAIASRGKVAALRRNASYAIKWRNGSSGGGVITISARASDGGITVGWRRTSAAPNCGQPDALAFLDDLSGRMRFHANIANNRWVGSWRYNVSDEIVAAGDFAQDANADDDDLLVRSNWGLAVITARAGARAVHQNGTAIGSWRLGASDRLGPKGDFDGDDHDEIVIRSNWGLGVLGFNQWNRLRAETTHAWGTNLGGWRIRNSDHIEGVGNFDSDRNDELFVRNSWGIGFFGKRFSNAFRVEQAYAYGTRLGGWTIRASDDIIGIGNFDNDPADEILVRSATGIAILGLVGSRWTAKRIHRWGESLGGWRLSAQDTLLAIRDFDGDDRVELLIHSGWGMAVLGLTTSSGLAVEATMVSGTNVGGWAFASSHVVRATGDYDGDGRVEILLQSGWGTGRFEMSGRSFVVIEAVPWVATPTNWRNRLGDRVQHLKGADLDHDGKEDLILLRAP